MKRKDVIRTISEQLAGATPQGMRTQTREKMVAMIYEVMAEPDGQFWLLTVPAIERVTQARNSKEIPAMAKELIEIMTGEADAEIELKFVLPESIRAHLANVERARTAEEQARRTAALELRAAAQALRAHRLSYEDVGVVLGVSHQRAHQLVNR